MESIACCDAQEERLQFMKRLVVPSGYHAQPSVDLDRCFDVKVLSGIASTLFCPVAHIFSIAVNRSTCITWARNRVHMWVKETVLSLRRRRVSEGNQETKSETGKLGD